MIKITGQIVFIIFLLVVSWQDIRSKSIAVWVYGLFGSVGWFLSLCRLGKIDWEALACGAAICATLLALSRLTEGAIGEGDGYFFVITGLFLGAWKNVALFCGGVMTCGFCCMGIAAWSMGKNISIRRKTVPFLPFLVPVGICLAVL